MGHNRQPDAPVGGHKRVVNVTMVAWLGHRTNGQSGTTASTASWPRPGLGTWDLGLGEMAGSWG